MTDLSRRIDDFLALAENDALNPRLHILARQLLEEAKRELVNSAPITNVRTVSEIPMAAFADAAPQRDELNHEQTILTYNDKVGIWDLAFFESGEEFPDKWFGDTHWIDITGMWPGVIAQVASFASIEPEYGP